MKLDKTNKAEMNKYKNEIEIFKKLNHPNLIKFIDSFPYKINKFCIVMEYADDGDLYGKIKKAIKANTSIPENTIWKWFLQICFGLRYLHNNKIIHRDIKSQNIFMNQDGTVKLGDFGISKVLKNNTDFAETSIGTPYFLSPEICNGQKYQFKSDIWMLGCVLYEMLTLDRPFKGKNLFQLMISIINDNYPPIKGDYSDEIKKLVDDLLKKDQNQRPSITEILEYPIVKKKMAELNLKDIEYNQSEKVVYSKMFTVAENSENVQQTVKIENKHEFLKKPHRYCWNNNNVIETISTDESSVFVSPDNNKPNSSTPVSQKRKSSQIEERVNNDNESRFILEFESVDSSNKIGSDSQIVVKRKTEKKPSKGSYFSSFDNYKINILSPTNSANSPSYHIKPNSEVGRKNFNNFEFSKERNLSDLIDNNINKKDSKINKKPSNISNVGINKMKKKRNEEISFEVSEASQNVSDNK